MGPRIREDTGRREVHPHLNLPPSRGKRGPPLNRRRGFLLSRGGGRGAFDRLRVRDEGEEGGKYEPPGMCRGVHVVHVVLGEVRPGPCCASGLRLRRG